MDARIGNRYPPQDYLEGQTHTSIFERTACFKDLPDFPQTVLDNYRTEHKRRSSAWARKVLPRDFFSPASAGLITQENKLSAPCSARGTIKLQSTPLNSGTILRNQLSILDMKTAKGYTSQRQREKMPPLSTNIPSFAPNLLACKIKENPKNEEEEEESLLGFSQFIPVPELHFQAKTSQMVLEKKTLKTSRTVPYLRKQMDTKYKINKELTLPDVFAKKKPVKIMIRSHLKPSPNECKKFTSYAEAQEISFGEKEDISVLQEEFEASGSHSEISTAAGSQENIRVQRGYGKKVCLQKDVIIKKKVRALRQFNI